MVGILAANSAVSGEYEVSNSLRFNDDDSAYLSRTNSSGGDRQKFTNSFWIKRGNLTGSGIKLFDVGASTSTDSGRFYIGTFGTEKLVVVGGATTYRVTTQVFRDSSAWYHIVVAVDSTDGTADNRVKIYVNGNQVTAFDTNNAMTQNQNTPVNENTKKHEIGRNQQSGSEHYDGYITEWHLIDGQQLSSTDFGEFDDDSGIWKPKAYSGSYGTNGAFLQFKQTGTSQNSSGIGADTSGNDNHFAVTNLAATDVTEDTCTNNFATFNSLFKRTSVNPTFSEGNCKVVQGASNGIAYSTQGVYSGKWYAEIKVDNVGTGTRCGILEPAAYDNGNPDTQAIFYENNGNKKKDNVASSYGASYTDGDIIGIALDADNGTLAFYKNGASQGNAFTGLDTNITWLIGCHGYINSGSSGQSGNYGNPSFAISSGNADDNGYGNFEYAPPSGYLALCTKNLATELSPTIDVGSDYFNTLIWSGNSANRNITGVGFQPDFVWIKCRSDSAGHVLFDSSRGASKRLVSNAQAGETTTNEYGFVTAFGSDGFTLTGGNQGGYAHGDTNLSGRTYVGWNWIANASTTSSDTNGTITSTVQANQTAGFSVVTWTGNDTSGATVGHGLGKQVDMVITKRVDAVSDWNTWHNGLTGSQFVALNKTNVAANDSGSFPDATGMNSTVFKIGNGSWINGSSSSLIAFCFASIEGYSKIGSCTGNGDADGTFVYTGFRPAWVMFKNITSVADWLIYDTKRIHSGTQLDYLEPNTSDAEGYLAVDVLSNGFKLREESSDKFNTSGDTYIFMAFAENPFVDSNGVPVTAR